MILFKWSNPFTPAVVGMPIIFLMIAGASALSIPIWIMPIVPLVGAALVITFFELFTECDPT